MKVVVASTSALKVEACRQAFGHIADLELIAVKAASGVAEQPLNDETLAGAFNRINHARQLTPGADVYVSIENGIFQEDGKFIDRAIVVIGKGDAAPEVTYSEGVEFPAEDVAITRARGFDKWTVGRVMEERGIVAQHDDPHLTLSGKSRAAYIHETARAAVWNLFPAPIG